MANTIDITTIGELLIDLTQIKIGDEVVFLQKPGGAPANVAVAVSRLGGKSAFIGKVGHDTFGLLLEDTLKNENVETTGLRKDKDTPTTLAFVHLDEPDERRFSFYRNQCADTQLRQDELDLALIKRSKVLHFGSVSLTDSPAREAVFYAVQYARENGVLVSYDPNYRKALWGSDAVGISAMKEGLKFADIVKVSQEELKLITAKTNLKGELDLKVRTEELAKHGVKLVIVTLGSDGAFFRYGEETAKMQPSMKDIVEVDPTGAGDAFFGGFLCKLTSKLTHNDALRTQFEKLTKEQICEAVKFANAVGALAITKHGAITAIPTLAAVKKAMGGRIV